MSAWHRGGGGESARSSTASTSDGIGTTRKPRSRKADVRCDWAARRLLASAERKEGPMSVAAAARGDHRDRSAAALSWAGVS